MFSEILKQLTISSSSSGGGGGGGVNVGNSDKCNSSSNSSSSSKIVQYAWQYYCIWINRFASRWNTTLFSSNIKLQNW